MNVRRLELIGEVDNLYREIYGQPAAISKLRGVTDVELKAERKRLKRLRRDPEEYRFTQDAPYLAAPRPMHTYKDGELDIDVAGWLSRARNNP